MAMTSPFVWVVPWLSIAAVVALGAVAVNGARYPQPLASLGRRLRLAGTVVVASLAVAGTVWQAWRIGAAGSPLQAIDVAPRATPSAPRIPDLQEKIKTLENQVNRLKHSTTIRSISADTEKQLSDYLRQFGSHRVIVSYTPDDVEAYDYATQLANVLKSANWDARGPEATTIFGNIRAMPINVYDDAPPGDDTARTLMAGFAKFNIPFQTRVAAAAAPADAAVELFVGAQPIRPSAASVEQRPH
jgi:hypothetical protein